LGLTRELTLEEIGRRLSVTRERVRQIEAKALQKIRASRGNAA
jgi:DNA-directed RNA polymerase sigma subunit (sigma70/sigma32)